MWPSEIVAGLKEGYQMLHVEEFAHQTAPGTAGPPLAGQIAGPYHDHVESRGEMRIPCRRRGESVIG